MCLTGVRAPTWTILHFRCDDVLADRTVSTSFFPALNHPKNTPPVPVLLNGINSAEAVGVAWPFGLR